MSSSEQTQDSIAEFQALKHPYATEEQTPQTCSQPRRRKWKYFFITLLAVLLVSGITCAIVFTTTSSVTVSAATTTGAPVILMIGDSITQLAANPSLLGFQSQLSQDYVRRADVINRGASGWTTKMWRPQLPKLAKEWQNKSPSLVTIFLGANDAALPNVTQYVPIDEYANNLEYMTEYLGKSFGGAKFIFLTPPAFNDTATEWQGTRTNANTKSYAMRCKQVGSNLGIPVIDLWTDMQGKQSEMLIDGLHLSVAGNNYVHSVLKATIESNYPHLAPENIAIDFT